MKYNVNHILLPQYPAELKRAQKDRRQRLARFVRWLDAHPTYSWDDPLVLPKYEHHLLQGPLKPSSIRVHMASIRGRYRELLEDPEFRKRLLELHGNQVSDEEFGALVRNLTRLLAVKQQTRNVRAQKAKYTSLTENDLCKLLDQPDVTSRKGMRDAALIGLMIATGIREQEVCQVRFEDLEHLSPLNELCLFIPQDGSTQGRLIPYGYMEEALSLVYAWVRRADITEGYIFRGFIAQTEELRAEHISPRAIQKVLNGYRISSLEDVNKTVKPMDLRRAYAKRLVEEGVSLVEIQRNLGLKTGDALLNYVGEVTLKPPSHRTTVTELKATFRTVLSRCG